MNKESFLYAVIKTLKINHYIKNLVVFVPLVFSMSFINPHLCMQSVKIFAAFCLISSAVYIMNDLVDKENDKKHPVKCKRPIASGKIPMTFALFLLLLLLVLSCLISFFTAPYCLVIVLAYFVLNIFYSLWLKKIALIDAACIAVGFIFRIVAGCFAIIVPPSPLVILMTFFISNFFTFTKRKLELQLTNSTNSSARSSISVFDINTINQFILINAVLSVSFYITYMLDESTIAKAGTSYLYLTVIPFTLIVYRLFLLINSSKIEDDPIIYIEQDKVLKWLFLLFILIFAVVFSMLRDVV